MSRLKRLLDRIRGRKYPLMASAMAQLTPEEVAALLRRTAATADYAAQFGHYEHSVEVFGEAARKLEQIAGVIERSQNLYKDGEALITMISALDALNPGVIKEDPQKATREFGRLFPAAGRLARNLPTPLNTYGRFLEGLDGRFFESMRLKIVPHGDTDLPKHRKMEEAMRH